MVVGLVLPKGCEERLCSRPLPWLVDGYLYIHTVFSLYPPTIYLLCKSVTKLHLSIRTSIIES